MHEKTTVEAEQAARTAHVGYSYLPPVLAGLALALAIVALAPRLLAGIQLNGLLIFAAGAAAAVLFIRLVMQREHRQALQRTVSQIVGEDSSPEVAITRILQTLCVSHGWDAALEWKVNAEESRLEFRSAWGTPGKQTEGLIRESKGLSLANGVGLPGQVWKDDRSIWANNLDSLSPTPHTQSAQRYGMVSGCSCARGQQGGRRS